MANLTEDDVKKILELKEAGVPMVIGFSLERNAHEMKSVIYAAQPAKSKEPRILWTPVWSSDPYPLHQRGAHEGTLRRVFKLPIKKVTARKLVGHHADGGCRFASACVELVKTGKYDARKLPHTPSACREYPRILMMDEAWARKIEVRFFPKPKAKRTRKKKAEPKKDGTNG